MKIPPPPTPPRRQKITFDSDAALIAKVDAICKQKKVPRGYYINLALEQSLPKKKGK